MDLQTFINQIEDSVDDIEAGTLSAESRFREHPAWDSLAVLMVSNFIEMDYGVTVGAADYENCATVAELYAKVRQRRGER